MSEHTIESVSREERSFSPEAEFQRNLLASGLFGKLLVVHNQGK